MHMHLSTWQMWACLHVLLLVHHLLSLRLLETASKATDSTQLVHAERFQLFSATIWVLVEGQVHVLDP